MLTRAIPCVDDGNARRISRDLCAAPASGWRSTITSAYCSSVRIVSGRLSPLLTLLN